MMSKEELLKSISEDSEMDLVADHGDEVIAFDTAFGKDIVFRVAPYTRTELIEKVQFGKSLTTDALDEWRAAVADVLLKMEPELLFTLRYILFVGAAEDMPELCSRCGLDPYFIADEMFSNGGQELSMDVVGISWFYASSVCINVAAMKACVQSQVECGDIQDWEAQDELEAGVWTTLLHELRHQQVDGCPYEVPWICDADLSEEAVEAWAREMYANLSLEHNI